jgi:hypothetical protein
MSFWLRTSSSSLMSWRCISFTVSSEPKFL